MNSRTRAFICGIKGKSLNIKEIKFIKKYKPWGVILFSRNIKTIKQTQNLTTMIRKIMKNKNYPIILDEEGGKVSRLRQFIDTTVFTAKFFGDIYKKDKKKFEIYSYVYVKQISYLLNLLGINFNTVPVLDLFRKSSNNVIGSRSYSNKPNNIFNIGKRFIFLFHKNKIGTIIKHIPGHGLSKVDSHKNIPIIDAPLNYLKKNDFHPFKKQISCVAMTGHLIFKKIDPHYTVTHSKKVIKIIRKYIGFKEIILSDDISMKALKYSITENTKKAFTAGCNLVLHCNGNISEMVKVAENSPFVSDFILKKTTQINRIVG